jgi:glutamate synthase (NADPH/NADH) small chain
MTLSPRASLADGRIECAIPDHKPLLTETQAVAEANRCLYCHDAPCIQACPTGINIPEFIRRIATGNVGGSAETILEANILGHSCASVCPVEVLCAGSCVYNEMDQPAIQIGRLQRYATTHAYDAGMRFFSKGAATGHKVALVGAGPASLACAHELTRLGHDAIIYEGRDLAGGLNTTGVAPYKLQAGESLREVAYVQAIGFTIRNGVNVGRDVTFAELERDHDAVFLGIGLGPDSRLSMPGEDLEGCEGAVAFIERMKNDPSYFVTDIRRALVVGGGNTAIDAVRELRALGVPDVTMVYRRGEAEMSGYAHEMAQALQEGVKVRYWSAPLAVTGEGRVTGLKVAPTRVDGDGRLVIDEDQASVLPADLVLKATGQEKLAALVAGIAGIEIDKGRIRVDAATGQTGHPRYFAGGDCANGGKEVVNAAAEGKRAALGIHALLTAQAGSAPAAAR